MKIPKKIVETVDAKIVTVMAKVCDNGTYELLTEDAQVLATHEGYVPSFFPEVHYGDYLDLHIELETGKILNWRTPDPAVVAKDFGLLEAEE